MFRRAALTQQDKGNERLQTSTHHSLRVQLSHHDPRCNCDVGFGGPCPQIFVEGSSWIRPQVTSGRYPRPRTRFSHQRYAGRSALYYPSEIAIIPGNIEQIFSRDAWPFVDKLTNEYQPIVKLHGMYGVCITRLYNLNQLSLS